MNKLLTLISLSLIGSSAFSQSELDSIFTNNGNLAVNIKEITEDAVKFAYPGEDLQNSIYKSTIYRIKHKSGRVEVFNEVAALKTVKGGRDWENVSISRSELELRGLYKLDEVTSKATGATSFSNVNTVKDRAYKKLKIEAAMVGGNTVYIVDQQSNGVRSTYYGSDPARTNLTGVAYSNSRPSFDEFVKLIGSRNTLLFSESQYLGNNSTDLQTAPVSQDDVVLSAPRNESGFIMVKANFNRGEEKEFRVTYFDKETVILMERDSRKIYNYVLRF